MSKLKKNVFENLKLFSDVLMFEMYNKLINTWFSIEIIVILDTKKL